MIISMYMDTAVHYELCKEKDATYWNGIYIDVPRHLLIEYFQNHISQYYSDEDNMTFDKWVNEEYTWDDVDDLLPFIEERTGSISCVTFKGYYDD